MTVRHRDWAGSVEVYASAALLAERSKRLIAWTRRPDEPIHFGPGIDAQVGGFDFQFKIVAGAKHVRCLVEIASRAIADKPTWRMRVELPTELGLVERFAAECAAVGPNAVGDATLVGLAV